MTDQWAFIGGLGDLGETWTELPFSASVQISTGVTVGNYLILGSTLLAVAGTASSSCAFRLDPTRYPTVPNKTLKIVLRAFIITNAAQPAATFNFGLAPVATWGGASGAAPTIASIGADTATAGSIANPASGGPTSVISGEATYPSAGYYALRLTTSVATTSNVCRAFANLSVKYA